MIKTKTISINKIEKSCQEVSELLRALSHPQRLLLMSHLSQGPKTVTDLQDLCQVSQSQLSQFLIRMKAEGLLNSERKGKFMFYSIADNRLVKLMETIQNLFCH